MRAKMLVVCFAAAGVAMAQPKTFEKRIEVIQHGEGSPGDVMYYKQGGVTGGVPGTGTIQFISAEVGMPAKLVKGAPYTAEAVTETVQVLADGNRITRRTTAQVARDGEGRTRRHDKLGGIGPWAASGAPELIFISDPVAKLHWVLEVGDKTARKMPLPFGDPMPGGEGRMLITHREQAPGRVEERQITLTHRQAGAPEKAESLGKRNVEGVVAEGTRTTTTIPAGDMGNERPIEIVSERWLSPELQTVVMTRHNDPRIGETTYRLTNIVRAEPARSLFEVPPDYQVKEIKGDVRITRKERKQ